MENYFLCVRKNNQPNYKCKKFDSFYNADLYFCQKYNDIDYQSKIIYVSKLVPPFLYNYFIRRQLRPTIEKLDETHPPLL